MKVNELFYSVQGEGFYTGTPAVFVRLAGCNLCCPFCDTAHAHGQEMAEEDIVRHVCQYPARHVVLTGGEPGMQLTPSLIERLHASGRYVQVETNGTYPLPESVDWVTCSPKTGGKLAVNRIDELKVVYLGQDLAAYEQLPAQVYCLQPCSGKNTESVVDYVLQHPRWRLSLQTHKFIGVR